MEIVFTDNNENGALWATYGEDAWASIVPTSKGFMVLAMRDIFDNDGLRVDGEYLLDMIFDTLYEAVMAATVALLTAHDGTVRELLSE